MKKTFLILFFSLMSSLVSAEPDTNNLVRFGLSSFTENNQNYLVVSLQNEKNWHTYWKNPGDAGTPTDIHFYEGKKEIAFSPLEWMVPHRYFEAGDLLAFGYEGTSHYFFKLDKKVNSEIKMEAKWLVCRDICVPGKGEIFFKIEKNALTQLRGQTFSANPQELKSVFESLPKKEKNPEGLTFKLSGNLEQNNLTIHYSYPLDKASLSLQNNFLTAFPTKPLGFKREELFYDSTNKIVYGRIKTDWEGEYQDPEMPMPKNKQFKSPLNISFLFLAGSKPKIVNASFKEFQDDSILNSIYSKLEPIQPEKSAQKKTPQLDEKNDLGAQNNTKEKRGLIYFLFLAFLGGLILNLMPCVLPVISLKLYSLLKQQSESDKRILKHNLSYTAGILSCFIALAAIIIGIKKSGENIGWGFQLQSPVFLVLMVFVLFIFCLNLFGLFEFATPGGRTLGNREIKEGFVGDFFSGIFATILSTPCSAPFLGTALTFAFTTSNVNVLLIFLMIGLGLASPFLVTGFFPQLTHFLPKPGLWMEHLKKFLGFTLLLTTLWLYDVLYSNNLPSTLFNFLNLSLSLLFFTFYLRKHMQKNKIVSSLFLLASILSITFTFKTSRIASNKVSVTETPRGWEKFDEEKLKSLNDQYVFIDFTAEWCFTCKVNEKLLLNTSRFSDFAQKNRIMLMKGDWTKKDDAITNFLKRYNVFGVPAYFLKKKNGEIIFLGELVTLDKIQEQLN
jgi:thiol:disulfide interchange protein DsbD